MICKFTNILSILVLLMASTIKQHAAASATIKFFVGVALSCTFTTGVLSAALPHEYDDHDSKSGAVTPFRAHNNDKEDRILNQDTNVFSSATGQGTDVTPYIVGGQTMPIDGYWRFYVFLYNGKYMCGGILVAPNVVVSAAHCAYGKDWSSAQVALGKYCMRSDNCGAGTVENIPIELSVIHPNYDSTYGSNDIWMIKLKWSSTLYSNYTIDLDSPTDSLVLAANDNLITMGLGTLDDGSFPTSLQYVTIPFVKKSVCARSYQLDDSMLCAGSVGKDSCGGDSGGPLYHVATKKLVGIVSFGYGCGLSGYPGVYASVSAGYSFISGKILEWGNPNLSTQAPTRGPTQAPSRNPTQTPTRKPTRAPTTSKPVRASTRKPTRVPTSPVA